MPTPRNVKRNSKGEGGFQKPNFLKKKYDIKMEFPEGWGVQTKIPSVGALWIFAGITHYAEQGGSDFPVCG